MEYYTRQRGVAILFTNDNEYVYNVIDNEHTFIDPNGNYIIARLTINKQTDLTIVNIYGPNGDLRQFYLDMFSKINFEQENVIFCGDWNLILDPQLDIENYKRINNPRASKAVLETITKNVLIDVWRILNGDIKAYTWRRKKPRQQARLDYFLVSPTIFDNILDGKIIIPYRSDHNAINIMCNFSDQECGRGYWKFNNSLLKDPSYCTQIKNIIKETKNEYGLPVQNETIEMISNAAINFKIPVSLFLETLFMEIRGKTISHATWKKCQALKEETDLEEQISTIQKEINTNFQNIDKLQDTQRKLEYIRDNKTEDVYIRSRTLSYQQGDKPSAYCL